MIRIVFLGYEGDCRSLMAETLALQKGLPDVEILRASVIRDNVGLSEPEVVERFMAELGIDAGQRVGECKFLGETKLNEIQFVVAMDGELARYVAVLPGNPVVISWNIEAVDWEEVWENVGADGVRAQLISIRDEIGRRVEEFFDGGYMIAMEAMKKSNERVLDCLSDGIIAHDAGRIVRWFNRAAERITGYSRGEIVGRDCHEIFGGEGICGKRCLFKDGVPADMEQSQYPLKIVTRDGGVKTVDMLMTAMRNDKGEFCGVLAQFNDVTEVMSLRHKLKEMHSFHGIIGMDAKMQAVYELINDLAGSDCPVLIEGQSGTGKELVACAIHGESLRADKPFITVNCGALPEGLLESELFGHVRGAFTGAVRDKKGRFELADGGTIFLDEVAELSAGMQVKLLRVLQEGTFERVGGEQTIRVNVRVISATNKNLRDMVRKKLFREDLFYRLCVVPVHLPSLRERRNDIPLLINHFIRRFSEELNRPISHISDRASHYMIDYPWPGNVRELQNALQYAFVKCKSDTIGPEHLPPEIVNNGLKVRRSVRRRVRKVISKHQLEETLRQVGGKKTEAAGILGISRATLYRMLNRYGLNN